MTAVALWLSLSMIPLAVPAAEHSFHRPVFNPLLVAAPKCTTIARKVSSNGLLMLKIERCPTGGVASAFGSKSEFSDASPVVISLAAGDPAPTPTAAQTSCPSGVPSGTTCYSNDIWHSARPTPTFPQPTPPMTSQQWRKWNDNPKSRPANVVPFAWKGTGELPTKVELMQTKPCYDSKGNLIPDCRVVK